MFYRQSTLNHINFISPRVSITTVAIVVIYIGAIWYFNSGDDENQDKVVADKKTILKQLGITLVLVIALVYMSIQLAKVADAIVKETGMSPSSVGAVLVGASTSLPEFVSAFNLAKSKKYDMAFSATLGSNLFNFLILALLDVLYKVNITSVFTYNTNVLLYFGIVNAIIFYFLLKVKTESKLVMASPYILSIGSYVLYLVMYF